MKSIIITIVLMIALNATYSQTTNFMKIHQKPGVTFSAGNTVDSITFSQTFTCGDVILYGGETYPTVQIGDQCWFAKNLNIGTMIAGSSSQTNNGTIEKYCSNDLASTCITYGGLYQWQEAIQYATVYEGAQGICPAGWHIPTFGEYQTLALTVNNDANALKAIGQGTGAGDGTNTSGFSALLAGSRYYNGSWYMPNLGMYAEIWSSHPAGLGASSLHLEYDNNIIVITSGNYINHGFSVRCLKD